MAAPLAPTVNGPIVTSSDQVLVSGALAGATVELLVGSSPVGSQVAVGNGNLWVALSRALVAGEQVAAVQTVAGVSSKASNWPVPVVAVPTPLPVPVFLSPMSQFMSHVLLGGLVPGAKVEVESGGVNAGAITAAGATGWVPVNPAVLAAGGLLTARQKSGALVSPTATSTKLVAVNARVVPAPKIGEPIRACETALNVLDCIPAADLIVENGATSTLWTNIAAAYGATGAAPFTPGPMKIVQRLPGAGTQSPDLVLTVAAAITPDAPTPSVFCPESKRITVGGLKPGGVLTLWKKVWDQPAETEIGAIGIGKATEQVDLPEVVGGSGPVMQIVVRQSACGLTSAPGVAVEFVRPDSGVAPLPTPAIMPPLFACARVVRGKGLAMVPARLFSSRFSAPLSDWVVPNGPDALLFPWFPLAADDLVLVEQQGCGAPARSAAERVQPLPVPLPSPTVGGPVRPGATAVAATGFLPGARGHLMVDWVVRASIDAWQIEETFHLTTGLAEHAKLWAFQTMCALSSPQEGRPVVVAKGQLSAEPSPSLVNAGAASSIAVHVRDTFDGKVINGLPVQIGGASVGLSGTAFNWTAPTTGASAAGVVLGGSAYQNAAFTVGVRQAVPVALGLYDGPGMQPGYARKTDVAWTLSPQWAGGAAKTLNAETGTLSIEGSPVGGVVTVSVALKVQLAADAFYGFDAETIAVSGVIANLALTKPSHAVSAIVTVAVVPAVNDDGEATYQRLAKVDLYSLV